jgi:hypothetical protein
MHAWTVRWTPQEGVFLGFTTNNAIAFCVLPFWVPYNCLEESYHSLKPVYTMLKDLIHLYLLLLLFLFFCFSNDMLNSSSLLQDI